MNTTSMKILLAAAALCGAARAETAPTLESVDVKPLPHYGRVARKVIGILNRKHLLAHPFDDEMSCKAWSNLVTQCDYSHSVFLQSDLDAWEPMKTGIDDALREGDVQFGYEVHRVFVKRLGERVAFVTNLLETQEFDFSVKEDYLFKRDKAPWPATTEEAEEIWRRRIKNEMLAIMIGRELDAEDEAKGKKNKKKKKSEASDGASTNDVAEASEPEKPPKQVLLEKYRHYLQMILTESDEESVLQRYLVAVTMAYDPHSAYMSPMRKEDFDMEMNLSLFGVGAVLSQSMDDGALEIKEIMKGGPLAREGSIKVGHKIVGVGQGSEPVEDITWKPMRKSIKKIRGPKDTRVVLEVTDKNGGSRRRVALIRDEIKLEDQAATGRVETVTLNGVERKLGYVKLPGFYGTMDKKPNDPLYRSCSLDVAKWVSKFNTQGAEGLVLDLRGNGGGSLKEAVLLTALFVRPNPGPCPVVQIREKANVYPLYTFPDIPTFAWRRPLIVLIDRFSASASEIVAGALQDTGRAIVIGDHRSHGKGTVQTVMELGGNPETPNGSVKVTTARFYRINGSSTQEKGVESDICLPSSLDERTDIGENNLPNALPWSMIEPLRYDQIWNMPNYVPQLKALSETRLKDSAEYARRLEVVKLCREASERRTVSLERAARRKMMREDRDVYDAADELDEMDGEDDDDSSDKKKDEKKDDFVLKEALNILSDLVRLTEGAEAPDAQARPRNLPPWLRALGGDY
ncbi:MAG: carboxy terminal-processing peptidase [Kiritimatiellae bacterium]|nr:carboxy terminal-processing peptidase [Kiritimatiellia bacterium]